MDGIVTSEKKYVGQTESQVTVSFQLNASDWLQLKESIEWHRVEEMITGTQVGTKTLADEMESKKIADLDRRIQDQQKILDKVVLKLKEIGCTIY